jgi:Xaa-Pro dipeptidase
MNRQHRQKLLHHFESNTNAVIYLKGGEVQHGYDTDRELDFKQESNFLYLTGIEDPDFGLLLDCAEGTFTLLAPRRDATYATWYGAVHTLDFLKQEYDADAILYADELPAYLQKRKPSIIYCYNAAQAEPLNKAGFPVEVEGLRDALVNCRVTKSDEELDLLRHASEMASEAHMAVLAALEAGINEAELRALFLYHCNIAGQRHEPYIGIHGGGHNAAILHYIKNDQTLADGQLYLIDAGAEFHGYVSDITRTYPVSGTFSPVQRELYDLTLSMQLASMALAKPGSKMEDLHMAACSTLLDGLLKLGYVKGSMQELMEKNIFALFFPHGIGHFLGLDTHDVGGYPKGVERIDRPGIKYLRVRRTLEKNMVITVEPEFTL